jgi:putative endonuclease
MYYVYAIRSILNGRIYIGQTENLEKRIEFHNKGKVKSTKNQGPWEFVAVQNVESRAKATWVEKNLKNSHGARLRWLKEYAHKNASGPEGG